MSYFDLRPPQDVSRWREDEFLAEASDDFRARALERADRLREVSDVADMSWPPSGVSVERVRPARKPDDGLSTAAGIVVALITCLATYAAIGAAVVVFA